MPSKGLIVLTSLLCVSIVPIGCVEEEGVLAEQDDSFDPSLQDVDPSHPEPTVSSPDDTDPSAIDDETREGVHEGPQPNLPGQTPDLSPRHNPHKGGFDEREVIATRSQTLDTTRGALCRPACTEPIEYVQNHLDLVEGFVGEDNVVQMRCVHPGGDSYWNCTLSDTGVMDGVYDSWCVDADIGLGSQTVNVKLVSTYDEEAQSVVEFPDNLDEVNWLVNQGYVGQTFSEAFPDSDCGDGVITYGTQQRAIWALIEDHNVTSGLGEFSDCHADALVQAACGVGFFGEPGSVVGQSCAGGQGDSFVPSCQQSLAIMFHPVDRDGQTVGQVNIGQIVVGEVVPACTDCRDCCLVVIDEDGIDNDISSIEAAAREHAFDADRLINDDRPRELGNAPLRWNERFPGDVVLLPTGQVEDEGWFTLPSDLPWSVEDFVAGTVRQSRLDKINGVRPMRNRDLAELEGQTCVAVVYDSDISINYGPINANMQGARLGLFTFTVLGFEEAGSLPESGSSESLDDIWLRVESPELPTLSYTQGQ